MKIDLVINELISNNVEYVELSRKQKYTLLQKWRECFAYRLKEVTGKWQINNLDSNVFFHNYYPSSPGIFALEEYFKQVVEEYYILPESSFLSALLCRSSTLIDFSDLRIELNVVPSDFSWTMTFIHETGRGPFFAYAGAL